MLFCAHRDRKKAARCELSTQRLALSTPMHMAAAGRAEPATLGLRSPRA